MQRVIARKLRPMLLPARLPELGPGSALLPRRHDHTGAAAHEPEAGSPPAGAGAGGGGDSSGREGGGNRAAPAEGQQRQWQWEEGRQRQWQRDEGRQRQWQQDEGRQWQRDEGRRRPQRQGRGEGEMAARQRGGRLNPAILSNVCRTLSRQDVVDFFQGCGLTTDEVR